MGVNAFEEGLGTVHFDYLDEAESGTISTETFNSVVISKYGENSMILMPNTTVTIKAGLSISAARFGLSAGSNLKINNSSSLSIDASGEFYAVGTESNPAK